MDLLYTQVVCGRHNMTCVLLPCIGLGLGSEQNTHALAAFVGELALAPSSLCMYMCLCGGLSRLEHV